MRIAPPNKHADAAYVDMRAYNAPLLQNPPRELWPLNVPYSWHVTANDGGVELWIDDAASVGLAAHDAPER